MIQSLLLLFATLRTPVPVQEVRPHPCHIGGAAEEVQCATYPVWEDRDRKAGRKIGIHIVILRSPTPNHAPDPIFVLAGGPGQAAGETAASFLRDTLFRSRRDIVFVDQRGTGESNALTCDFGDRDDEFGLDLAGSDRITPLLKECLAATLQHADPTLYTTRIAMQDLDAVRAALAYPKINLWGASYGTRAALEYLRSFPQHTRTVVLDGVAPFGMMLPLSFIADGNAALERLVADCAAAPACRRDNPTLGADLRTLLADLRRKPVRVSLPHPRTGEKIEVAVTPAVVLTGMRAALYSATTASLLPQAIEAAYRGEFAPIVGLAFTVSAPLQDQIAIGMHLSVVCSEDWPLVAAQRQAGLAKPAAGDYYGAEQLDEHARLCAVWPRGAVPADYYEPVQSDVPVLLLSGGIDPATPPRHAEAVLKTLPHGKHIVAPNVGHGVSMQGCAPELIKRFVNDGNADRVDGDCLAKLPRPTFFEAPKAAAASRDAP